MHATSNVHIDIHEHKDGIRIAQTAGELDMLGVPVLRDCLHDLIFAGQGFVLDFEKVTFLASPAIQTLVDIDRDAHSRDVRWVLAANHRVVTRPLEAVGLIDQLPMQPTVPAALKVLTHESGVDGG